jgi:hypothetical protein
VPAAIVAAERESASLYAGVHVAHEKTECTLFLCVQRRGHRPISKLPLPSGRFDAPCAYWQRSVAAQASRTASEAGP